MVKKKSDKWSETRNEKTYLNDWLKSAVEGLNNVDDKTAIKLMKKWVNSIVTSFDDFDDETAKKLLQYCGQMCARSWMKKTGFYNKKYELDTLVTKLNEMIQKMNEGKWAKKGNTIYEEITVGKCICPLVTYGAIDPSSKLCVACDPHWYETLFKDITGLSERWELIDSIARGGDACILRHHMILPKKRKTKSSKSK